MKETLISKLLAAVGLASRSSFDALAKAVEEKAAIIESIESKAALDAVELENLIEVLKKQKTQCELDLSNSIEQKGEKIKSIEKQIEALNGDLEAAKDRANVMEYVSGAFSFEQIAGWEIADDIAKEIDYLKLEQSVMIKNGHAFEITRPITVNGSSSEGKASQKRMIKFLMQSLNSEIDNVIRNTTHSNFSTGANKIEKAYERLKKVSDDNRVVIKRTYIESRMKEHRLAFKHKLRKEFEKEEEREIRERLREEAKLEKEISNVVKAQEKLEKQLEKELKEAVKAQSKASQEEAELLKAKIAELEGQLEQSKAERERALSMAQLTRSGHVYVISNRGSFGEGIIKIGMTRRLDPMDRVKELGDASVPFFFDVHGMISTDDAPALEKRLHEIFAAKRVNKINHRREFFNVTVEDVQEALNGLEIDYQLTEHVKAEQYEESLKLEGEAA